MMPRVKVVRLVLYNNRIMKFEIEIWSVKQLLDLVESGKIDLNPPYQRNPIWTKTTQKHLIQSIKNGSPIPNIFLYKKSKDKFEMVDGQQRTRALKVFKNTDEIKLTKDDSEFKNGEFLTYKIPVTIITEISEGEYIEEFYYMVNSSGIHLNRPERFKAHYFDTNFLKLVEKITTSELFQTLNIIPVSSQKRMMDRDLVEELCALILFGITDKKNQVDKIYESDITEEDSKNCENKFNDILNNFHRLNDVKPLKETRYRQRNDFYTLFGFIKDNLNIDKTILNYFYNVLLVLEKGIRPTKEACRPLSEYALNCVSQSNSAKARQARIEIINSLLLNQDTEPTGFQNDILEYYSLETSDLSQIGKYLVFNLEKLQNAFDLFHSKE